MNSNPTDNRPGVAIGHVGPAFMEDGPGGIEIRVNSSHMGDRDLIRVVSEMLSRKEICGD